MPEEQSSLVYSTDREVPRKGKNPGKTVHAGNSPPKKGLYVRLDRKGRRGKSVTLIEGLPLSEKDRVSFLTQLKNRLGTGGALKDNTLEIQGDHRDTIFELLQRMGYSPKRAGG